MSSKMCDHETLDSSFQAIAGPVKHSSRPAARMTTSFQHNFAVHQHVLHSLGILMRVCKCCPVNNPFGVKNTNIRRHAFSDDSPVLQTQLFGIHPGHFVNRSFQRYQAFFPDIFPTQVNVEAWLSAFQHRLWGAATGNGG